MAAAPGIAIAAIAGAAIIASMTLFTVDQTQQALVVRLGDVRRVVTEPGLNMKVPVLENIITIDKRILDIESPPQEIISSDQKRLVVDAFARYKISDPLLFFQATGGSIITANQRLSTYLNAALRSVLGESSFIAVVREKREDLMARIREQMNNQAKLLGINVLDVRIRRADLPNENSNAVFKRMQTERQREAAEIRAQGTEISDRIRAQADRTVTVTRAEADRQAREALGQGEGDRARILAEAFSRDTEFFNFWRSMQAYEAGLRSSNTRLVLSPDSDFFRFLNDPAGKPKAQPER